MFLQGGRVRGSGQRAIGSVGGEVRGRCGLAVRLLEMVDMVPQGSGKSWALEGGGPRPPA
jgi:hypothetical protein